MILTEENLKQTVKENELVIVDFWAPWCGPCRALGGVLQALEAELEDQVLIGKVNVDEQQQLAVDHSISAIPVLVFYKNGEERKSLVGVQSRESIMAVIDDLKKGD